jgi:hypothetical protein
MVANNFPQVNCISSTVSFSPDWRTPTERKADSIGVDELLDRANYVLRDDPELLFQLKRRYRTFARYLYYVLGGGR